MAGGNISLPVFGFSQLYLPLFTLIYLYAGAPTSGAGSGGEKRLGIAHPPLAQFW
jgi:hypothetical protein